MNVNYEGTNYTFDLEDLDLRQAKTMEAIGIKNLQDLQERLGAADLDALTFGFWLMLSQSDKEIPITDVAYKPLKFMKALGVASGALNEDGSPNVVGA